MCVNSTYCDMNVILTTLKKKKLQWVQDCFTIMCFVFHVCCPQESRYPYLSPMADEAITQSGIQSLVYP